MNFKIALLFSMFGISSAHALAADSSKMMNISLPFVSFGGEGATKVEWNMAAKGGLALELDVQRESEFFREEEMEKNNFDSLMMKGSEIGVVYSSYGNPKMMSGGFWGVGVGYRTMKGIWSQTPGANTDISGAALTAEGKVQHSLAAGGVTGRARIGYRYVAESFPFSAGAYLGLHHFQNNFKDTDEDGAIVTKEGDLKALERRMTSRLEPGIEIGMAF